MSMELLELKILGISSETPQTEVPQKVPKTPALIGLIFQYVAIPWNQPISFGRRLSVFQNVLETI